MELWNIWLIGVAIAIIARVAVTMIYEKKRWTNVGEFTDVMVQLLIIISIVIVTGIPISEFLKIFLNAPILVVILLTIVVSIIIYQVAFLLLGLYNFKHILLKGLYAVSFIISIIAFITPTIECNRNMEEITKEVLEQTQEEILVEFNDVPIKEVVSQTYDNLPYSRLKGIFDYISSSEAVSYCYEDEGRNKSSGNALIKNCKIYYINKDETPYVKIYSYYKYTKVINHATGEETIKEGSEQRWQEYDFYLPREILYYMYQIS